MKKCFGSVLSNLGFEDVEGVDVVCQALNWVLWWVRAVLACLERDRLRWSVVVYKTREQS